MGLKFKQYRQIGYIQIDIDPTLHPKFMSLNITFCHKRICYIDAEIIIYLNN